MAAKTVSFAVACRAAGSGAAQSTDETAQTLKIDILVKQPSTECEAANDDEIVVCAEQADNEAYRLRPIANAEKYKDDPLKAEIALSDNATMAAEGDSAELGSGVISKRAMVRLKIGF